MAQEYDLVIIGGGPGGYVAAIRAAQLGLKTALVEKNKLGGTCLHKGCIPSKALLKSAELYATTKKSAHFGIEVKDVSINVQKVLERKEQIVKRLYDGVQYIIKKRKIDLFSGIGRILGPSIFSPLPGTVSVEMTDGSENEMLVPKNVLIATGSRPRLLPHLDVDGEFVITSDEAFSMNDLPSSLIIVGAGAIGTEWASMMADFGGEVTLIEQANCILPTEDREVAKEMQRLLKKKGVKVLTNSTIVPKTVKKRTSKIEIDVEVNGKPRTISAEKILVSVGREARCDDLGLQNTNIEIKNGLIQVNEFYQTKEPHIYAIGDVIGRLQLAHVASHEGIRAVEHMACKNPEPILYDDVPRCVYSNPEMASVGLTEDEAMTRGHAVQTGKFSFQAIGKALISGETDGFVKIVSDRETNDILGVHMIGPHVTNMISEAGLARLLDATPWEVANTIHPHPSLSEAIGEAALAVDDLAIHL